MIKAKIGKNKIHIKSSYNDLTFSDFIHITLCKDDIEAITFLTGLTIEQLSKLDNQSHLALSNIMEFLNELPEEATNCKDIREQTFGQKILLQNKLGIDNKNMLPAIALVIYEYDYDNNFNKSLNYVMNQNFTFVYSRGINYLNQLNELLKVESEQLSNEDNAEQKRAGIDMFEEFGAMNTVNALAGGDILKYNEVLKMDYNTVFVKLKMSKVERIFQENYNKILSKKK